MGSLLSFDKYPTQLETLLSTPPAAFAKVSSQYTDTRMGHLLRAWRVSSDSSSSEELNFLDPSLRLNRVESYLVLFIRSTVPHPDKLLVPKELHCIIESLDNVGEKDLSNAFSRGRGSKETDHGCTVFLWHGKSATPGVKATALLKTVELDDWLRRDPEHVLQVMLGGGRVVGSKVKKGERVSLEHLLKSPDNGLDPQSTPARDLIKWLIEEKPKQPVFPLYADYLNAHEECCYVRVAPPAKPALPKPALPAKPAFTLNLGATVSREDERKHIVAKPNLTLADIEEDDDIRYTNRAQLKMEMFANVISELCPGLYVAGDIIARDKFLLKSKGVTHIVNCAGNVCANYFPDDFRYLSYFLKDSNTESIECVFYETMQFIDAALAAGGKVLVHCMQGVSRSVTVCLAYIIFRERKTFDTVIKEAREKRGICSPNFGFQVQLMWWHKRLEGDCETLPFPRVFAVGSHEPETPRKIVVRMLRTVPYSPGPEACRLDPRGIFLVHTPEILCIWEGANVYPANCETYRAAIDEQVRLLQTYERAPTTVLRVKQGAEDAAFWESLKQTSPPTEAYREEPVWNSWYPALDVAQDQEPRALGGEAAGAGPDERPTLFAYPDVVGMTVFDDEELGDQSMVCVCKETTMYVWRGAHFREDPRGEFVRAVKEKHWAEKAESVSVVEESASRESEAFLSFF